MDRVRSPIQRALTAFTGGDEGSDRCPLGTVVLPFALKRRPRQEWILELQRHGILAGESRSYADVLADEQVQHNDTIESIRLPNNRIALIPRTPFHLGGGQPVPALGAAPELGAHTGAILASLSDLAPTRHSYGRNQWNSGLWDRPR